MYGDIDKMISGARRQKRTCILLGDWNAVVGPWQEGDDQDSVGLHGVGCRNERGSWLAHWAGMQQLTIANTITEKVFEEQWTHSNGDVKRQIDFAVISRHNANWIVDAGASEIIGTGKDHRTVYLHLAMLQRKINSKGRRKNAKNLKGQICKW